MLVLGFPEYILQSSALARAARVDHGVVSIHEFPDQERLVSLPPKLPDHVVFCRSLHMPNVKLVELMLAAKTARELGGRELTLVAPYLCYMRQDKAFAPGQAVSQRVIGRFLADYFDTVITVDPHLHRVKEFAEAVPARRTVSLSAASSIAKALIQFSGASLVVGPDRESEQWVRAVATAMGLDYVVADKARLSDHRVEVRLPPGRYRGQEVILVDDVASTGETLVSAAQALNDAGVAAVHVAVTHALFLEDVPRRLRGSGVKKISSTDSVPHSTNCIALAPLLAAALRRL